MKERGARLGGRKGVRTRRGLWHAKIKQNHYSGNESCIHFTTDLDRFFNVAGEEEVESIRPDAGPCLEHSFPTPLETRRVQSFYMGLKGSQEQEESVCLHSYDGLWRERVLNLCVKDFPSIHSFFPFLPFLQTRLTIIIAHHYHGLPHKHSLFDVDILPGLGKCVRSGLGRSAHRTRAATVATRSCWPRLCLYRQR
jgi:hypothetical protein